MFRIEQKEERSAQSFGNYEYEVFENENLIAIYWHDYRGNEHGINFIKGKKISSIPSTMPDFLLGGGPQPHELSEFAINFINKNKP